MHLDPHDDRDGRKVWLSESEVEQLESYPDDSVVRIAFGLGGFCQIQY